MLEEARNEPQSRKQPQSDAGGSRDRTTAKEPVVRGRKTLADEATRLRGPREEHTQQQGDNQKNRKSIANIRQDKEQSQQQARHEQSQQQAKRASKFWRKMENTQSLTR